MTPAELDQMPYPRNFASYWRGRMEMALAVLAMINGLDFNSAALREAVDECRANIAILERDAHVVVI